MYLREIEASGVAETASRAASRPHVLKGLHCGPGVAVSLGGVACNLHLTST